ncbi:uncharacterized protein [Littorina saxatilis]|uniref:Uncharacterized protein n=1 Tax=Littorina saxatilis TaxID=31220 RepID=A0AAN9G173_9CAEN
MAACVEAPLVTPKHYDPMFKVDTLLHEPTLLRLCTLSEIGVDMISYCTQLDVLCKKELIQQPTHSIQKGRTSNAFADKAIVVEDRMRHTVVKDRSLPPSLYEYLEKTSLNRMFPRPAAFLKDPSGFSLSLEQSRTDEYLSSLNQLNQLATMSHQMKEDIAKFPRPKYLAHQLALIYQSICNLPSAGVLAKYKKSVEDNFKTVKQILNNEDQQDEPLPDQLREWVWELTTQIAELVESLPATLTQAALLPACVVAQL